MPPNPNPAYITGEMWRLWEEASRIIPGVRLGGIFANKAHYHNTVINNLLHWPNSYSIKLVLDLVKENRDKARGLDLTMSDTEMVKWTRRMRDSALDPRDDRLACVREFYGTLDNKTVYGLIKDEVDGTWRRSTADLTHLWHGHLSIFTLFVNKWVWLAPLISVWKGETYDQWKGTVKGVALPVKNDKGEDVKYWQNLHNNVRGFVAPAAPAIDVDGDYGDATAAAFAYVWTKVGGKSTKPFTGDKMTGWLATEYHKLLVKREIRLLNLIDGFGKPTINAPATVVDREVLAQLVNEWMFQNLPDQLKVDGTFTGKVQFSDEPA